MILFAKKNKWKHCSDNSNLKHEQIQGLKNTSVKKRMWIFLIISAPAAALKNFYFQHFWNYYYEYIFKWNSGVWSFENGKHLLYATSLCKPNKVSN